MNKRIIRHIILLVLLAISIHGYSQQDPMFTQYQSNPVLINPAYSGIHGNLEVNNIFRKQWVGFQEWSPTTASISVTTPFLNYKVGMGFTFVYDQVYPIQQTAIYMDYAYHIKFNSGSNLSMGLKGGFSYYQIDLAQLESYEYDSYVSMNGNRTRFLPNFGIGAYYYSDKYYIGLSMPKLLRNNISDKNSSNEIVGRIERHWFFQAGYVFTVKDPIVKFRPSVMSRVVAGSPPSVDISGTLILYDKFWFGLMYRWGDSFDLLTRFQVNDRLNIGYSFDLTNSKLERYNTGSHEIFLQYEFSARGRRILSPRYF